MRTHLLLVVVCLTNGECSPTTESSLSSEWLEWWVELFRTLSLATSGEAAVFLEDLYMYMRGLQ